MRLSAVASLFLALSNSESTAALGVCVCEMGECLSIALICIYMGGFLLLLGLHPCD